MELFYRKHGEGRNIIILHGLFGSSDNWMTIAKMLADEYTVWTIDQRNHGQSPHSDDFTYEAMAGDLMEFIEDHNIHDPYLIGHSMGGKTVIEFLIRGHLIVPGAIIADIGPKAYPVHHQKILDGLNSIDIEKAKGRKEIEDQLKAYISEFGIRAFLLKNVKRKEDGSYEWSVNLPVITEQIENVGKGYSDNHIYQGEVLFLRGGKSEYIKDEDFKFIKKIFPKAELETIENSGHWLHAEQPEPFVEIVRNHF
ncbi:MAG: alpha/beta fold hydrolase [Cytophagales bacterium]